MKKLLVFVLISVQVYACTRTGIGTARRKMSPEESLRRVYSGDPSRWPRPVVDTSVQWLELEPLPAGPLQLQMDSLNDRIQLGKALFFDPRLSDSKKISCSSCHLPERSWTDGIARSIGHEDQVNKRNSPTILNTWFYKELFWDGRSNSLEDQAFSPINGEAEMHSDMPAVLTKLRRIKGYRPMFEQAFGSAEISPETLTGALAVYQRTIVSQPSSFDRFMLGEKDALTDDALRGLHIFRMRAGCMNCHHGPMFSDNGYHNTGIDNYDVHQLDKGRYNFTKREEDAGKFRTPSLRDVTRTGPWMHNGSFTRLADIIEAYNRGMITNQDPRLPAKDKLIKPLALSLQDKNDLLAFLHAISAAPAVVTRPVLPAD